MSASLWINKIHWPVTTLGPGRRFGLWVQGCTIRCKDCVSKDTWDATQGAEVLVGDLLDILKRSYREESITGITISGGEPFEQLRGLRALLAGLADWRALEAPAFDVLCYSGYSFEALESLHASTLKNIDLLCSGPYVAAKHPTDNWSGSGNQGWHALTPQGAKMLAQLPQASEQRSIQLSVKDGRVWFIGVPGPGDMQRLATTVRDQGLNLDAPSWLS